MGLAWEQTQQRYAKMGFKEFFLILFVFGKPLCLGMCWRIEHLQILLESFLNYRIFQAMISWRLEPRACMECDEYKDSTSNQTRRPCEDVGAPEKYSPKFNMEAKTRILSKKTSPFPGGADFQVKQPLNFKGFSGILCFQASYSSLAGRFHIRQYHPGDGNSEPMKPIENGAVAMEGCCQS